MLTAFQPMLRANHETETRKEACQTQNITAEKRDKITLLPNPEVVDEVLLHKAADERPCSRTWSGRHSNKCSDPVRSVGIVHDGRE